MRRPLLVGLAFVLLLGGCKKMLQRRDPSGADAGFTTEPTLESSPPLTPQWRDLEVRFSATSAIGTFSYNATKLTASFREVAPGDSIEMGTDRATATTSRFMSAQVDMGAKLAKLRPSDAFDFKFRFNPETKVNLVLGQRPVTIDAPPQPVAFALTSAFKKVADAPLALPPPEKAPTEHTILFIDTLNSEPIGPATTVDAIDWVAIGTKLPDRRGKPCPTKKTGDSTGDDVPLVLRDEHLVVFDVRTTKEVAAKDFKAPEACPSFIFTKEATSYPSKDEMKAWLRSLRTKK